MSVLLPKSEKSKQKSDLRPSRLCLMSCGSEPCFVRKATAGFYLDEAFDAVKSGWIKKAGIHGLAGLQTIWLADVPADPYRVGTAWAVINAARMRSKSKQKFRRLMRCMHYSAVFICCCELL